MPRTRVVIVGGGFAGLNAAKTLGAARVPDLDVTLIDQRNHHLFQPLLYQVATAGLSPADISTPIRRPLRRFRNIRALLGTVHQVDPQARLVRTSCGDLPYDYLILACGATHSYFGNDEWQDRAPGLKTIEQAVEIRRRILLAFERAEVEKDPEKRKALMTFVVVGGGPTGVELAGALGEISRFTLSRDFRNVDPSRTRIVLIDGGERVLRSFDPSLSEAATRKLEELGVTVWTSMRVTSIDEEGVSMEGERLNAATVLWAAGIRASELNSDLNGELDSIGRIKVQPDLSLSSAPEIFVVGDQAHASLGEQESVPPLAPGAIQMGISAANNILSDLRKEARTPFKYRDKGMMATIGRAAAIAQKGNLRIQGFFAWLAWCFVHIFYLIGFRNKFLVLAQWLWSYLRFGRGARLITQREWRMKPRRLPAASTTNTASADGDAPPEGTDD